jgi:hypothetical protein
MNDQLLYHGTNTEFTAIDLAYSRNRRDFGKGFYTTTLMTQAEDWAKNIQIRYGGEGAFLYVFEYCHDLSLKIKTFDGLCAEWLEMVKDNRLNGGIQHEFDMVKGPIANDNTMPTLALYVDGTLSLEATLLQLSYFKANDQVSFHTERSLRNLRLIERRRL